MRIIVIISLQVLYRPSRVNAKRLFKRLLCEVGKVVAYYGT